MIRVDRDPDTVGEVYGLNPYESLTRQQHCLFFMYTTYILFSEVLNKYYIGFTRGTVKDRLQKHLLNHKGLQERYLIGALCTLKFLKIKVLP